MKKYFLMLIVLIGFGISANAQVSGAVVSNYQSQQQAVIKEGGDCTTKGNDGYEASGRYHATSGSVSNSNSGSNTNSQSASQTAGFGITNAGISGTNSGGSSSTTGNQNGNTTNYECVPSKQDANVQKAIQDGVSSMRPQ